MWSLFNVAEHQQNRWLRLRRRNEIVSLNLVVNCAMLCFATVSGVTGTFGMNFSAWMPQDHVKSLVRLMFRKQQVLHQQTVQDSVGSSCDLTHADKQN